MGFSLLWWKVGIMEWSPWLNFTCFEVYGTGFHHLTVAMGECHSACASAEVLHLFSTIKRFWFTVVVDHTLFNTGQNFVFSGK